LHLQIIQDQEIDPASGRLAVSLRECICWQVIGKCPFNQTENFPETQTSAIDGSAEEPLSALFPASLAAISAETLNGAKLFFWFFPGEWYHFRLCAAG